MDSVVKHKHIRDIIKQFSVKSDWLGGRNHPAKTFSSGHTFYFYSIVYQYYYYFALISTIRDMEQIANKQDMVYNVLFFKFVQHIEYSPVHTSHSVILKDKTHFTNFTDMH